MSFEEALRGHDRRDWVEHAHRTWAPYIFDFVEHVLPYVEGPTDEQALEVACRMLDACLGCLDPGISLVDRLELERAAARFEHRCYHVETYAREARLTRENARTGVELNGRVRSPAPSTP